MKSKLFKINENLPVLDVITFEPIDNKYKTLYKIITGNKNSMFTMSAEWSSENDIDMNDDYDIVLELKNKTTGEVIKFE